MPARYPFGTPDFQRGPMTHLGKVFFVDSAHPQAANSPNQGRTPETPFASIHYAVTQCTANAGDIIHAAPRHVETIGAAAALTVNKAGVQIVGHGFGTARTTCDFTATTGTIELDAQCSLRGLVFKANVSAVAVGINVDADYIEISECFSTFDATGDDFVILMDIDTVNYAYVHNNFFTTEIIAGADSAIRLDTAHWARIEDNEFHGQWAVAPIAGEGALSNNLRIVGNVIFNADTSVYNGIDIGALSSTGIVANNRVTALYATVVAKIYRDGFCTSHSNSWANAVSERGTLALPATTSA